MGRRNRRTKKMEHLINIDENSRIKIEYDNYILQYKRKTEKDENRWDMAGYFPTLESLAKDWIINAPTRSSHAIHDLNGLAECIKEAEEKDGR